MQHAENLWIKQKGTIKILYDLMKSSFLAFQTKAQLKIRNAIWGFSIARIQNI
jgi:hypothetical protein